MEHPQPVENTYGIVPVHRDGSEGLGDGVCTDGSPGDGSVLSKECGAAVRQRMEQLRRALQQLPPRELDMLFATRVNRGVQDKVSNRFCVQQSNVSYHLERAQERIDLYTRINSYFSETRLRHLLYRVGCTSLQVQVTLGFVRTENQSVTARVVGAVHGIELTQGVARSTFFGVVDAVAASTDIDPADRAKLLALFGLISDNFNRLRAPQSQDRWADKIGDSNYTSSQRLLSQS